MGAITRTFANQIKTGGKLDADGLDLTDTFAFTGTVSGAGGINTPAFQARSTTPFAIANNTDVKIQYAVEDFDTDSCYDTAAYRFTPNVAGKYFVYARFTYDTDVDFEDIRLKIGKNGSTAEADSLGNSVYYNHLANFTIIELNGTTDYVEAFTQQHSGSSKNSLSNVSGKRNVFGAYKIVE